MREIKFRAWDKEQAKMKKDFRFDEFNDVNGYFADNDFVFMQYTGLKDKDGKEIYEGDIVRITLTQTEETRIGEVKYYDDNACYLVETTKEEYFTFMSQDIKSVEVLGNIPESKELLDEAQER